MLAQLPWSGSRGRSRCPEPAGPGIRPRSDRVRRQRQRAFGGGRDRDTDTLGKTAKTAARGYRLRLVSHLMRVADRHAARRAPRGPWRLSSDADAGLAAPQAPP